jgi:hypothetical protein
MWLDIYIIYTTAWQRILFLAGDKKAINPRNRTEVPAGKSHPSGYQLSRLGGTNIAATEIKN